MFETSEISQNQWKIAQIFSKNFYEILTIKLIVVNQDQISLD